MRACCEPGLVGVEHARVQHAVELERDVVGGDGALAGDLEGVFLERLDVGDAVEEGDQEGQARLQDAVELAHALDDPGGLLGHEADDSVDGEGIALLEVRGGHAAAKAGRTMVNGVVEASTCSRDLGLWFSGFCQRECRAREEGFAGC